MCKNGKMKVNDHFGRRDYISKKFNQTKWKRFTFMKEFDKVVKDRIRCGNQWLS